MKTINPFLRSTVYKHLSELYSYPEEKLVKPFLEKGEEISGILEALAREMSIPINGEIGRFVNSLNDIRLTDAQAEYVRLFDYRPVCDTCESYALSMQGKNTPEHNQVLIQMGVEEFYRKYGIQPSTFANEPPDHITTELEFMHYLSFCEGKSDEEEVMHNYVNAQKEFLENHLMKWLPVLCHKLESNARLDYFRLLAGITRSLIEGEMNYLNDRLVG